MYSVMMNRLLLPLHGILWLALTSWAMGSSSLTTETIALDGLPERLAEFAMLPVPTAEEGREMVDLTQAFKRQGVAIPDQGMIVYAPGLLMCRLEPKGHQMVNMFIDAIYQNERLVASYRMYVQLQKPMPPEQRMRTLLLIGFLPDPLLVQLVGELHGLRGLPRTDPPDPFDPSAKPVVTPLFG